MAHFYGKVIGQRGEASRLGGKNMGLETIAASWQGAVKVTLYHRDGRVYARCELIPWQGQGKRILMFDDLVSGANRDNGLIGAGQCEVQS